MIVRHAIRLVGVVLLLTTADCCNEADFDNPEVSTPVVINEIDVQGRDWVELYNTSTTEEVDLSGWIIADKLDREDHQYVLPVGSVIVPGGYLVIKEESSEKDQPGFSFGIKSGETVYLLTPEGEIAQEEPIGDVAEDHTWGRFPDGTDSWQLTEPTQGETNQLPDTFEFGSGR